MLIIHDVDDIGTGRSSCVKLFNAKIRVDDYTTYNSNFSLRQTNVLCRIYKI